MILKVENIFKYYNKTIGDKAKKTDRKLFLEWAQGKTTESFVNANMLELKKTGWMSNRGRQNVASFFAKDMKMDWRIGAAYFESLLLDYDVHSNYGNWMYVSGVGNDPRDRKFDVRWQSNRYDPKNKFIDLSISFKTELSIVTPSVGTLNIELPSFKSSFLVIHCGADFNPNFLLTEINCFFERVSAFGNILFRATRNSFCFSFSIII